MEEGVNENAVSLKQVVCKREGLVWMRKVFHNSALAFPSFHPQNSPSQLPRTLLTRSDKKKAIPHKKELNCQSQEREAWRLLSLLFDTAGSDFLF